MRKITYTCDICGAEKQPSKGWILSKNHQSGIWFGEWTLDSEGIDSLTHLCGDECAAKHLSRFLSGPPTRRIAKVATKVYATDLISMPVIVQEDEDDSDDL